MPRRQPTRWVEVDTDALRHNLGQVRGILPQSCGLLAVVKANGYGHGLVLAARAFESAGADGLGVTTFEEASELREAGVRCRALMLAPLLPQDAGAVVELVVEPTLTSRAAAESLSDAAVSAGVTVKCHLKVDTGMGRAGVLPEDAADLARGICSLPGLELRGIYTHLPNAQDDRSAALSLQRFASARASLAEAGIAVPQAHAANSAALLLRPESRLDMVRTGTLLYGQFPPGAGGGLDLRQTWRYLATFVEVKQIPKGWTVSYGSEYRAPATKRVGVLAVGIADGLAVSPDSLWRGARGAKRWLGAALRGPGPFVRVGGKPAPILGRVAAQMCVVDLDDHPNTEPGDVAEVPARRTLVGAQVPRFAKGEVPGGC
ncbi:MAG TPA: alanine racemase [Armatimonadota bacterium]|jgi:alanine racemase